MVIVVLTSHVIESSPLVVLGSVCVVHWLLVVHAFFVIIVVIVKTCELHVRGGELHVCFSSTSSVMLVLVVLSLISIWVLVELLIVIAISSEVLIRVILLRIG